MEDSGRDGGVAVRDGGQDYFASGGPIPDKIRTFVGGMLKMVLYILSLSVFFWLGTRSGGGSGADGSDAGCGRIPGEEALWRYAPQNPVCGSEGLPTGAVVVVGNQFNAPGAGLRPQGGRPVARRRTGGSGPFYVGTDGLHPLQTVVSGGMDGVADPVERSVTAHKTLLCFGQLRI